MAEDPVLRNRFLVQVPFRATMGLPAVAQLLYHVEWKKELHRQIGLLVGPEAYHCRMIDGVMLVGSDDERLLLLLHDPERRAERVFLQ